MNDDYDRSLERVARSEDQRARITGFGTTKQGRALARQYCERLADSIGASRRPFFVGTALARLRKRRIHHFGKIAHRQKPIS
jgi:hypothetical protein